MNMKNISGFFLLSHRFLIDCISSGFLLPIQSISSLVDFSLHIEDETHTPHGTKMVLNLNECEKCFILSLLVDISTLHIKISAHTFLMDVYVCVSLVFHIRTYTSMLDVNH